MDIQKILYQNQDIKYADFQRKLIPNIDPASIIGVRTPILRKIAKDAIREGWYNDFLEKLPHQYFDENQLHTFIVSGLKDFDQCITEVNRFLPFINNWATCDQLSPKIFKRHHTELLPYIEQWLESSKTYSLRFGIDMLMEHFLDADFDAKYLTKVATVKSDKYYVNMMIAWYFATALAKQWDTTIQIIESHRLEKWVHNKTIQKARESNRITQEQKEYLKTLKEA